MKKVENRQELRQARDRQSRSLIPFTIAVLVVLGLIFGGWGTVYAAEDSNPDDFLYPITLVVEYFEDFHLVTVRPDDPVTIGERNGIQIHERDRVQGMTGPNEEKSNEDKGPDFLLTPLRMMNQYGQSTGELVLDGESTLIDDVITPTRTISGTQWMTRTMNGYTWGPGPCFEDPENPESCDLTAPHGYTYTHGVDGIAPYNGEPPVIQDHPSGFGPAENPSKEVPADNNSGQMKGK